MIDHIENEYAKFWIEKDILHFVYKNGISIDQSVAMKVVEDRLLLQQGKAFLILCDMRGIKKINKSARNYLALEGSTLIKAVALLVNNPLSSTISGFYIKTSNPTITTQVFTEEKEALKFLNNHVDE
ncbi:hypothetical protein Q4Q34_03690 [Flavivirga abyssicola]|uniref:DUF7793 family protein n=1 Tax=Flavivirga abyssicola TaxID=3063533 RepID=UPI0026DF3340|nr:hypothetical protein [Flavivirga sp. MEBiC07777]WVK14131.1 hypothetical protein Q4Q34_03690 [Flavivirga sp. MEBiC07777]